MMVVAVGANIGTLYFSRSQKFTKRDTTDVRDVDQTTLPTMNTPPLLWLFASTVSVITTKHLLENAFHFLMHLLFLHHVGALVLKTLLWSVGAALRNRQPSSTPTPTPIKGSPFASSDNNNEAMHRLVYAASISGPHIYAYQALHHSRNLPIAVMILGLDWRPRAGLPVQFDSELYDHVAKVLTLVGVSPMLVFHFSRLCYGDLDVAAGYYADSNRPTSESPIRKRRDDISNISTLEPTILAQ
jgi:hypothetical protein